MITFNARPIQIKELIRLAYDFEVDSIENGCADPNPYFAELLSAPDGEAIIDGINTAVEMRYNRT